LKGIKIAASSDIHSPKFLNLFIRSLSNVKENVDLFILCGDLIYKGRFQELKPVLDIIKRRFSASIYACFGNEEFDEVKDELVKNYGDIVWLDDSYEILKFDDLSLGLIGSRGCLDRPTRWQLKNVPNIRDIYRRRVDKMAFLIKKLNDLCDHIILFTHYAPTYLTLRGENPRAWPELGCRRLEKIIRENPVSLVLHGHSHNSIHCSDRIDGVPVYNVSLPANNMIITFNFPFSKVKQTRLTSFFTKFLF